LAEFRKWFPSAVQKVAEVREVERKAAFYGLFVKKGAVCFDLGANMGNRISPLLRLGALVVAVEPQKKCYKFLQRKFGKKIRLVKKGLGEAESIKEFHISDDSTISSFSGEWINAVKGTRRFMDKNWNKSAMIAMTTADILIERYGKPAFIKIDVEGYELEVLKGLTQPVEMISFEYTVPEQPGRAIACIEQVAVHHAHIECNYSIGEDLVWAMEEWISPVAMKSLIVTEKFMGTSFGDIYIRTKA